MRVIYQMMRIFVQVTVALPEKLGSVLGTARLG
jgi:hypothetical protein